MNKERHLKGHSLISPHLSLPNTQTYLEDESFNPDFSWVYICCLVAPNESVIFISISSTRPRYLHHPPRPPTIAYPGEHFSEQYLLKSPIMKKPDQSPTCQQALACSIDEGGGALCECPDRPDSIVPSICLRTPECQRKRT